MSSLNTTAVTTISEPLRVLAADEAVVNFVTLIGLAALLYDHALTFGDEVSYIWCGRKTLVSVIFLYNRYATPLILAIDIYETIALAGNTALFCKVWTAVQSYLTIVSFMSIHTIVAWRLYALHGGQKWIGRLLWIAGFIYFVSSTALITYYLIPVIQGLQPVHHQCVSSIPTYLWTTWLPSVFFESFVFFLTVHAMLRHEPQHSFSSLSVLLYRDGVLYFVAVTVCSLFSLLVWALAPPAFLGLARYFALAAVNIAGSRLVLNLKGFSASRRPDTYHMDAASVPLSPLSPVSPAAYNSSDCLGRSRGSDRRTEEETSLDTPVDLEMYSIERDCQQLGTKLLRHA